MFTARVWSTMGGYILSLSVHTGGVEGGGAPVSGPSSLGGGSKERGYSGQDWGIPSLPLTPLPANTGVLPSYPNNEDSLCHGQYASCRPMWGLSCFDCLEFVKTSVASHRNIKRTWFLWGFKRSWLKLYLCDNFLNIFLCALKWIFWKNQTLIQKLSKPEWNVGLFLCSCKVLFSTVLRTVASVSWTPQTRKLPAPFNFYHHFQLSKNNQGDTWVENNKSCGLQCGHSIRTILMDDLLEVTSLKTAVMKIDIQSHEHKAFAHTEKILKNIFIPSIFMEWEELAKYYHRRSHGHKNADKTMVLNMIKMLQKYGYTPYVNRKKLDLNRWNNWHVNIVWERKKFWVFCVMGFAMKWWLNTIPSPICCP